MRQKLVISHRHLDWGLNLQPRYMPWPGIQTGRMMFQPTEPPSQGEDNFFSRMYIKLFSTIWVPFSHWITLAPLENQCTVYMGLLLDSILSCWSVLLFIPISHCLDYSIALYQILKSGSVSPTVLFFFKIILAVPYLLHIHVHFKLGQSISTKKFRRDLFGIAWNYMNLMNLREIKVLTVLNLSIHEHGIFDLCSSLTCSSIL